MSAGAGLPEDRLEPSPEHSTWGRNAMRVYLGVAAIAFALMVSEMVRGESGFGTFLISIVTAPWSGLLMMPARALAGRLSPGTMRGIGVALVVLSALLNAAVIRGIAARAQRDVGRRGE